MHENTWKWSTVGMFLLGMGALIPTSAHACAAPNCMVGVRFPLPEDGGAVPSNIPGLVTVPPLLESVDSSTVRLLLPDGTQVPATVTPGAHQTQVLVPDAPLVPGTTYRIEAKGVCQFQPTQTESVTFTAGPALPLPTTTGTLTADTPSQGIFNVYGDSSCGDRQVEGNFTTLRFTPSPELVPFLPWVHWTVEVDGEPWSYAKHSGLTSTGEESPEPRRYEYNRQLLFLYTFCDYVGCADSYQRPPIESLPPGRHRATLKATLEHANITLPPVSVDFELSCAARVANAGMSQMSGCSDGGTEMDGGIVDGGIVDEDPLPEPVDTKKGCTQAGGGLTVLGLLSTLWLLGGRNSRRAK
ncbi:hypothetical protein MXAN_1693 [Myxococcus xanthus DK 1622]|uniref:SbsA Ig-like domain-containing protein n=1 Tax=Myxococcus xanthus (strain DK1622) TaxID=246197 RepID=Q1DBM8_MYXXD|nr:hypothetical protein [Myxococcus xanthus]ABF89017.1 hypothetical protein MXAN_1693 [Myxococcus xanthus DK 1622]QVW70371.1 hypothetical protein JTM82_12725 [Myxococcus xanthus DZ2]NOJ56897.1 hypothetical protein [Myxococcus xanthus]QPM81313.1 hypothetical protein I5Q59_08435 [Myxococcus xanthus]UEO03500.1 hypothetical protein K1515_30085 [Myxococcus xanthus DZ2]